MNLSVLDAAVIVAALLFLLMVAALIVGAVEHVRVARWEAERAADDRAYAQQALGTAPTGKAKD